MNYVLSIIFGCLSAMIIYAEVANVFDFKHNLIYDFVTAPDYDTESPNYFYISNVTRSN